jgi:LuxR family maltose regulon positive regulatory protein
MPDMPSRRAPVVDTRHRASPSFAAPEPTSRTHRVRPEDHDPDAPQAFGRHVVAMGPGRPGIVASIVASGGPLGTMSEYPIQVSKVQAPPLRDETLARDRLLEWLSVKVHGRVTLVVAEAGYGKTTLLSDFSRRTRVRTMWYRLDRGDRDWVAFLAYLVAAIRVHVPGFGSVTDSLLRETASSAPPRETVLDTFLLELGQLPADPTALIFDDFHLVDDAPEIREITIELLARAPERLAFVFVTRRLPPIPLARLRALGEVAELGTDELRFDAGETERLFRETYEMRLEPGLIAELSRRTEGWAASLQLVRTALHDRDPGQIRAFIRSLSGAEGHLYDYLAEEVVADLPTELQDFLMRTSLLEIVDLELGPIAADVPLNAAKNLIDEGERLGLFGRRGPHTRHQVRAHPLVRDFLQARLARSIGGPGLLEIHRRIASAAESIDWRVATHHYLAANDEIAARRVLASSIEAVLATGAYAAAEELSLALPSGPLAGAPGLVLASRLAQQRGDPTAGAALAEDAWAINPHSTAVLLNLIAARSFAGNLVGAIEAGQLLAQSPNAQLARIGETYGLMIGTSVDGSLEIVARQLEELVASLRVRSNPHYLGVALSNYSYILMARGDATGARDAAEEAITTLGNASRGLELVSARLARSAALAQLGNLDEARKEIALASAAAPRGQAVEVAYEAAEVEILFGEADRARALLDSVSDQIDPSTDTGAQAILSRGLLALREGSLIAAAANIGNLAPGQPRTTAAFEVRRQIALSMVALAEKEPTALELATNARALAARQGATLWEGVATLLEGLADRNVDPSPVVSRMAEKNPALLSIVAEALLERLSSLDGQAQAAIAAEAEHRPQRWRSTVRRGLVDGGDDDRLAAANLLARIGVPDDVRRLSDAARMMKDKRAIGLSRALARRLAARVFVEDLGRVEIVIGERIVDGAQVRRKVLALLCLLLSKPDFAASREEVLDGLWPDLDPGSALNSLNQTAYFLRRVFEINYSEETSPGYLVQDGETIWLDSELIGSRSQRCRELIRASVPGSDLDVAAFLAKEYRGQFALDFAYDDWASSYRDSLHASYLRVMEQAIRMDIDAGEFARGTLLAERAIEVEPNSEELRVCLVRLYRLSGAHAAAAEQYAHYAEALREIGVDPPAFAEV